MKSSLVLLALSASLASATFHPSGDHRLQITSRSYANVTDLDEINPEDYDQFVVEDDSEEGWSDIGVGVMMFDRDFDPAKSSNLATRDLNGKRDWGRTSVDLELDERSGEINWPRSWDEVNNGIQLVKRKAKAKAKSWSSVLTWYTGHDLLYPSCCDRSGFTPTDKSMIAAVTEIWSGKPACGTYVQIRPKGSKKSIVVRVVDTCAGCPKQKPHFDLTKTAFSKLMSLDIGIVSGAQVKVVKSPVKKYTTSIKKLYGPKSL